MASYFSNLPVALLAVVALALPSVVAADPASLTVEGVTAMAGSSLTPPNPNVGCDRAKQDATNKAAGAGYRGRPTWDRLSSDSDCRLTTEGSSASAYVFIFHARGTFSR